MKLPKQKLRYQSKPPRFTVLFVRITWQQVQSKGDIKFVKSSCPSNMFLEKITSTSFLGITVIRTKPCDYLKKAWNYQRW